MKVIPLAALVVALFAYVTCSTSEEYDSYVPRRRRPSKQFSHRHKGKTQSSSSSSEEQESCRQNTCWNDGTCLNVRGHSTCCCTPGYQGERCEKAECRLLIDNGSLECFTADGIATPFPAAGDHCSLTCNPGFVGDTSATCRSDTTFDAPLDCRPEEGSVSLTGGSEGLLQVFINGFWGAVCGGGFDDNKECLVACKQMGFSAGVFIGTSGKCGLVGGRPYWLDNVVCQGTENRLTDCLHGGLADITCDGTEQAFCRCCHDDSTCDNKCQCLDDTCLETSKEKGNSKEKK